MKVPKEGHRMQWLKCREHRNQNEYSILQCVHNNKNDTSYQKCIHIHFIIWEWLPSRLGCRIHRLYLCRGVRLPGYDIKQFDGEAPVMLELWGMMSIPSLPSLPGPLLPGDIPPEKGPISGLNRTQLYLNWIVWNGTVWHWNCIYTKLNCLISNCFDI